jgi:hypothetical protein
MKWYVYVQLNEWFSGFVKDGQPVEGSLSAERTGYEGDWVT